MRSSKRLMDEFSARAALKWAAVLVFLVVFQQSARAQDDAKASSADSATPAALETQNPTGNVPRLIKFSGVVTGADGKPASGAVALTFTLYNAQEEGVALWTETQTAQLDSEGHYAVLLGAGSTAGLPLDLFASGGALWLGVQPELPGAGEQSRVLLVAVPYALKAADADTLGGKPASAYALSPGAATSSAGEATSVNLAATSPEGGSRLRSGQSAENSKSGQTPGSTPAIGGSGTPEFIPIWTGSQTLGNSVMFETGGEVGVGTKTPGARVDAVSTGLAIRGTSSGPNGTGVVGSNTAASGSATGVSGSITSTAGSGVVGDATATSGYTNGVYGSVNSPNGTGVSGVANGTSGGVGVSGVAYATSGSSTGVSGLINGTSGAGVEGIATATSGYNNGVYGQSASTQGYGVNGDAIATSGTPIGVFGQSASPGGTGVVGVSNSSTGGTGVTGSNNAISGSPVGVLGGTSGGGFAVWGAYGFNTTSTSGVGVKGSIESGATGGGVAGQFFNVPAQGLLLQGSSGSNLTQVFSVDTSGNLDISGNLTVAGSKSARVKLPDGRDLALYAVESPENWFEDFGTAELKSGVAEVALDPEFLQTVNTAADYHVFLTPNGDCHGLYVASKTAAGFVVRELGGGNATIAFDYRIVARRRGFENVRLQEVHVPQGPQARPASLHRIAPVVPPPAPRISIPSLPRALEPADHSPGR